MRPRWQRWFASWLPGLIGHLTFAPRRMEWAETPLPSELTLDRGTGTISGVVTTELDGRAFHVVLTDDGWINAQPVMVRRWRRHR